ncbi:MAG: FAH family protein [Alphaproteobacteria bacterium]|nr:FAH family protein [Alphaproteobacteria bacterium]MBU1560241.1 FAH family protein [Alphaproteobacteria bacterium]MBU2303566.1 FAH family protein [Alphaproteobacteria bacterium]MBU2366165.1 FAH family protein [Alphaproteobacteria bacterium]
MRLIQFEPTDGARAVGVVDGNSILTLNGTTTVRQLALDAIVAGRSLTEEVKVRGTGKAHDYDALMAEGRVLPPLDHEDPAHTVIAGTGLTHTGSAAARSQMHAKIAGAEAELNDSMRIFKWGVEGGKPAAGQAGVQPEWFYKGDGSIVSRPGQPLPMPDFAEDSGEEPEVVGLYVIAPDGTPWRVGFAVGNETTDHVTEKKNYLYLAHAKLRFCAYGPELFIGDLPPNLVGQVRILRDGETLWEKSFPTGEDNMCHSLANLEYHHFKYDQFLRPGDVHVQFMGTSVASFGDGIKTQVGDVFEISIPEFGRPLSNAISLVPSRNGLKPIKSL